MFSITLFKAMFADFRIFIEIKYTPEYPFTVNIPKILYYMYCNHTFVLYLNTFVLYCNILLLCTWITFEQGILHTTVGTQIIFVLYCTVLCTILSLPLSRALLYTTVGPQQYLLPYNASCLISNFQPIPFLPK